MTVSTIITCAPAVVHRGAVKQACCKGQAACLTWPASLQHHITERQLLTCCHTWWTLASSAKCGGSCSSMLPVQLLPVLSCEHARPVTGHTTQHPTATSAQAHTHHQYAVPAWSALTGCTSNPRVCMCLQANALDSIWWCQRCEQLHRGCSSGLLSSSCSCDHAQRHQGKAWHREAKDSGSCGQETRPQAAVAAPGCRSNSSGRQSEPQTPVGMNPLLSLVLKNKLHTAS